MKALAAEALGTSWLVMGGCGSAILAGKYIGFAGISLAFGLTVLTMAFAIGHISGCHLNPAVSCGLAAAGRFPIKKVIPYIIAQTLGAIAGAAVIYLIVRGSFDASSLGGFAANGYGPLSPGNYSLLSCLICEIVMTYMFLLVIIGSTSSQAPQGLAPIAIGMALTLIHLISIPVTNTSVNPARSLSQALFAFDSAYLGQVWLFWAAPIIGAILAGVTGRQLFPKD